MARSTERDKLYKAIGKGERTSKKVATIKKADGTSFIRRNANQYGNAEGGNDYTEKRANRTDFYPKDKRKKIMETGGKTKEEIAYEQEQNDYMFNSQFAKGSTVKGKNKKKKVKQSVVVRGYFEDEAYEYGQGGKTKGGIYEVYLDMGKSGTKTIADFETTKDAKDFIYEYMLKHPKAKLGYDKLTHDYTNKYDKGGKTKGFTYTIGGL